MFYNIQNTPPCTAPKIGPPWSDKCAIKTVMHCRLYGGFLAWPKVWAEIISISCLRFIQVANKLSVYIYIFYCSRLI